LNSPSSISVRSLSRLSVVDRPIEEIDWGRVACAVLACGSEARSAAVLSQLPQTVDRQMLVLEFGGLIGNAVPEERRELYQSRISNQQFFVPGSDVPALIEKIIKVLARAKKGADTIFIDVSSMPRTWYLGIIMWFRFSSYVDSHRILLGYAGANYGSKYPARQIMELRRVIGTGGYYDSSQAITAIVSLGFDAGAALSVTERIEPDEVIAIVSETPGFDESLRRCVAINEEFLHHADHTIYLPHLSFSQPYRSICEIIAPLSDRNIVCIPFGPKTHIVALALAGLTFPRATSLHVHSRYDSAFLAEPNGLFCFAEVSAVLSEQN
jgi:hypothetical protein